MIRSDRAVDRHHNCQLSCEVGIEGLIRATTLYLIVMSQTDDASMPESMYDNPTAEKLCIMADSEGLSIERPDMSEDRYWITPGVTGWSFDEIQEWADELLSVSGRDWGMTRLHEGPVEVEIYEKL